MQPFEPRQLSYRHEGLKEDNRTRVIDGVEIPSVQCKEKTSWLRKCASTLLFQDEFHLATI